MGKKLFIHSHSGVIYYETQSHIIFRFFEAQRRKRDFSALLGKLDRIPDNIDQNLLELHCVSNIVIIDHRIYDAVIINAFCICLGITDGIDAVYKLLHRNLFIFQQHLSALDPAHV